MRLSQQLSISVPTPPDCSAEATCRLLHDGQDTGGVLTGAILEAALEVPTGWLVFLTHDVPYEEGLEIYLLSTQFDIVDHISIAAPYATAFFENLEIASPTMLRFDFLGERPWQLDLLDSPGFRLPFFSEPIGVLHPFGFNRHFRLHHPVLT